MKVTQASNPSFFIEPCTTMQCGATTLMPKDYHLSVRMDKAFVKKVLRPIANKSHNGDLSRLAREIIVDNAEDYDKIDKEQAQLIEAKRKQLQDRVDTEIIKQEIREATHEQYLVRKVQEWRNKGLDAEEVAEMLDSDAQHRVAARRDCESFLNGLVATLEDGYPESVKINGTEVSIKREF